MHATLCVCAHRHSNWHAHLWAICQGATTTTTKGKRLVTFTGPDFCSRSNSTGHFVIIIIIWHTQWVSGVCQLPSGKACQQGRHNCNSKTVDTFIALPCCDSFLSLSLSLSLIVSHLVRTAALSVQPTFNFQCFWHYWEFESVALLVHPLTIHCWVHSFSQLTTVVNWARKDCASLFLLHNTFPQIKSTLV